MRIYKNISLVIYNNKTVIDMLTLHFIIEVFLSMTVFLLFNLANLLLTSHLSYVIHDRCIIAHCFPTAKYHPPGPLLVFYRHSILPGIPSYNLSI
jgi:hypothetical protein